MTDIREEAAAMLLRWAAYLRAPERSTTTDRDVAREEKRARRFLSEEQFRRMRKRCRLRELPLPAIMPGVERIAVPLSAIHEETGHPNHAEMQYVVAAARHRRATRIFEFGTFLGRTTHHLAGTDPATRVWTLDLPQDENHWRFARHVGCYFENRPEAARITMLRQNSFTFDPDLYRQSMQFIWVDGDHSYEGVKNDTEKAFDMLAPGGVIMWHDFGHESAGLVEYFVQFTRRMPLFQIRKTSILLHIDGVDPIAFEPHPIPFSKSIFKPDTR
jgi:predicted O-methyltransferase YrrM